MAKEHRKRDVIVIGAGMAGLTAALYAGRSGLSVLVLESELVGGQIANAADIENYPGIPGIGGGELISAVQTQAESFGAVVDEFDPIVRVDLKKQPKIVETESAVYEAGAVILASSGAVMDLGMDVAAGMEELARHRPDITPRELFFSGIRIGQSVVGTMATTLLLAYSGGYLTLMMTFAAQGTRPIDFINNPFVAAESVKTLIGSFSLVLVAPFTAIVGALLYKRKWTRRLEESM